MRSILRVPVALALTVSLPNVALAGTQMQVPPAPSGPAETQPQAQPLTEEEKNEKAKELYIQAEGLAAEGKWAESVPLYEEAYYLVPGKHGFAHKVGVAAWKVKNCDKAYEYLTHFVTYAEPEKNAEKLEEAKSILGEIEAAQCRTPEEPEPEPEPTTQVEPVEEENPFETTEEPTDTPTDTGDNKKKGGKGLLAGGAVLLTLGVGGIAVGAVGAGMASKAGNTLDDLSSTSTNTGYPVGDYACRDASLECPTTVEGKLATGKALTYAGFIGGGVLLVTGIALIVVHAKKNKKASQSAAASKVRLTGLGPAVLPGGGGGASATLRF